MTENTGEHHAVGHVVPMKILVAVFVSLVVLTWITVAATWIDLGVFNLLLALAIATVKGALVALFFMHLRWDKPFNAFVFLGSLLFVAIFIGITLIDTTHYQREIIIPEEPIQASELASPAPAEGGATAVETGSAETGAGAGEQAEANGGG